MECYFQFMQCFLERENHEREPRGVFKGGGGEEDERSKEKEENSILPRQKWKSYYITKLTQVLYNPLSLFLSTHIYTYT